MSHELFLIPGTPEYAFAHRGAPGWHGLGRQAEDGMSNADVASLAGVDGRFEVTALADLLAGMHVATNDAVVIQNRPNGDRIVRGSGVSQNFSPWQPDDVLATADALTHGGATLDTVGMIGESGATIFMSFLLGEEIEVAGFDKIRPYLNVRFGVDGSLSRQIDVSHVRVVCANTLRQAWNVNSNTRVKVRNTVNADLRIAEARNILGIALKTTEEWTKAYSELVETSITDATFSDMVKALLPDADTERGQTRRENARGLLTGIYRTGRQPFAFAGEDDVTGQTVEIRPMHDTIGETRGTVAGALNAWQEFNTWYSTPRRKGEDETVDWDGWLQRVAGDNDIANAKIEAGNKRILAVAGLS